MSSRERVLAALHHEEPDRVPTALWGSYYSLQDETYLNLLAHLGIEGPVPPFRRFKPRNSNYLDDRILDRLGTDIRYVWSGFTDLGGARPDTLKDAWGVQWKRMGDYVSPVGAPLANASAEEIASHEWPDPERFLRLDELRARLAALKQAGDHAITARAVNSYGPFEQACAVRGREQFLMDLAIEPELASLIISEVTGVIVRANELYLDVVGPDIDIIEIPGDDYAGAEQPLISPRMFDEMFKPALERIIKPIKAFRENLFVAFHSDGAINEFLPRFVDLGIDLFHPLEPVPANDLEAIKTEFGDRLAFLGAIDIIEALPGTLADVESEVKQRIGALGPGGGYIVAPANHLQTDIPPENIVALYDSAQRYGRYPLN
jgi:uroporphyrinogen decarboxylase